MFGMVNVMRTSPEPIWMMSLSRSELHVLARISRQSDLLRYIGASTIDPFSSVP